MASPFSIFRRNQRVMLAVIGVLAMISFVFLDPRLMSMGGPGEAKDPIVVETNFAKLHERELYDLVSRRRMVRNFLQMLAYETLVTTLKQFPDADFRRNPRFLEQQASRMAMDFQFRVMPRFKRGEEEAAIESLLLSKRAEQVGIVISDEMINAEIKALTNDLVTGDAIRGVIQQLKFNNHPVSINFLFDAMRSELAATKVRESFIRSVVATPPGQRWDYFERLNRRADVEVAALPVANYLKDAAEPAEKELKALYEKHKDEFPNPRSPEPGFRELPRAAFEYFVIDYTHLADVAKDKITDEEVAAYYESHKDQYKVRDTKGDMPDDAAKPETKEPAGKSPENPAGETPEKPATKETPADKPGAKQPDAEKSETDKPAESKTPPTAAPAKEPELKQPELKDPAPKEPDAKAGKQSSVNLRGAKMLLVNQATPPRKPATAPAARPGAAAQTKPAAPAKPAAAPAAQPKPAAAPPATPPAAPASADPSATQSKPAETKPAETATPDKDPAAKPATTDASKPATEETKPAGEAKPGAEKPAEEQPRYKPLEEVRAKVIESLRWEKAQKSRDELAEKLRAEVARYGKQRAAAELQRRTPPSLGFKELAETNDVSAKATPTISMLEANELPGLGSSQTQQFNPFVVEAFGEPGRERGRTGAMPYKPVVTYDTQGNAYVWWKTEAIAERVPTFEQAKPEVVKAAKMMAARDLAKKAADKMAEEARTKKGPLAEVFAKKDVKFAAAGPFSWLTQPSVPRFEAQGQPPRISDVDGVDQAGDAFMRAVFNLPVGGVGAALNQPETVAYVVKVKDFTPSIKDLEQNFSVEPYQAYAGAAVDDHREIVRAWLQNIERQYAFRAERSLSTVSDEDRQ